MAEWAKTHPTVPSGYDENGDRLPFRMDLRRDYYERPSLAGGPGNTFSAGCRIEAKFHYSGSGPEAFGFKGTGLPAEWPHVTAEIDLPAGRLDLREALVEQLKAAIDVFLAEHGLEGDDEAGG